MSPRSDSTSEQVPESAEIWKWLFTADAIAPCYVRDTLNMHFRDKKDEDYFWLGRVPVRTVKLVGLVVGVQVYEKRVVYTLDDGTAVIDCIHKPPRPPPLPSKRATVDPKLGLQFTVELKPLVRVGGFVQVIGKVQTWHETRQIVVDTIEKCVSPNDEPKHWKLVKSLHETSYSLPGPFVIPPPHIVPAPPNVFSATFLPQTPSTVASTPFTSPAKSAAGQQSPIKLRHPSRVHRADLTANTFRIYVKHFMDHLIWTAPVSTTSTCLSTPTKSRIKPNANETPRRATTNSTDLTPRPHNASSQEKPNLYGFTCSYLRRVPELAEMAKRVVDQVIKQRTKEARVKAKEAIHKSSTRSVKPRASLGERKEIKIKRLFGWALVQLLNEGSIVIWNGPIRPYSSLVDLEMSTSGPWKYGSASTTLNSTVTSVSNSGMSVTLEDDLDPPSDPDSNEEAYVPLTPEYLASEVEKVLQGMCTPRRGQAPETIRKDASKASILAHLKRDDRWRNVGETGIEEALQFLLYDGRAKTERKGRWRLC